MRKAVFCITFFLALHSLCAQEEWKLAVQTWTFHKYSLLETIHKADTLGLKYLEVYPGQRVGGDIPGAFTYTMSKEDRARVNELLRMKGVKVIALGVIDKYYYTQENMEKYFAFAADMQIPFITAEPEWQDLDEFNRLAIKYNVKVGLHCHPKPASHYWHPDSTVKAMQDRSHIGAWPDLGHWARNGVNVVEGLKKMKGKLWGMHYKDIREFDNVNAIDTIFGKGVCDLPAVMKEMKQQGFKGVVTMEYEVHEEDNMSDLRVCMLFYEEERRKLGVGIRN
jgi:sugar phosphate isomerase/epimerase